VYIHNWYADTLLSVRILFDNHIFQKRDYVKRYEFNMGNRTIQLPKDYKPNYEFPNIIVTLNDDTPSYGQRPDVSQKIAGFNLDQIPVLYNQTNNDVLCVQEEMVNVPITCTINCESQFQAKEIAALVKRWLPVNKFITFLSYTSYLEVSPEFLSTNHFDPAIHTIANLYTKLNHRTGDIDYCYSLQYEPFIRLDSVSTSIPDSTQRSFQVSVDITFMVQQPLYMFNDRLQTPMEVINININPLAKFEPISDFPTNKMINGLSSDVIELEKGFVRRNFLVVDNNAVETVLNLDYVVLTSDQVTNTSTGGQNIVATKGADDFIYITLRTSETKYRTNMNTIPSPDGVNIVLSTDEYLKVTKDLAGTITVILHKITQRITVQFALTDLQLTTAYSYNLFSGNNMLLDYEDYTLDTTANSVTFSFDNSQFSSYTPSTTNPLIVQFCLKDIPDAKSPYGIPPKVGLMKVFNISQIAAEITWSSDEETTTQVEYGTTIEYGAFSSLKEKLTILHHVVLPSLGPNTTYHYRVKVTNLIGEEYLSEDFSFSTLI